MARKKVENVKEVEKAVEEDAEAQGAEDVAPIVVEGDLNPDQAHEESVGFGVGPADINTPEEVEDFEQEKVIPPAPAEDGAINDTGDALRADRRPGAEDFPESVEIGVRNNPMADESDPPVTAALTDEQREMYARSQHDAHQTSKAVANAIRRFKESL